jgi:transposase-like protein
MSKQGDKRRRAKHTLEFKRQAVRLVNAGQDVAVTSRVLDVPKAMLGNWIRASEKDLP